MVMSESGRSACEIERTDPEFARAVARLCDEVRENCLLSGQERQIAVLAALTGMGEVEAFAEQLREALDGGLTPAEAREIVYLAAPFLGVPRAKRFVAAANGVFAERGMSLPLPDGEEPGTRLERGLRAQSAVFGAESAELWADAPEETRRIGRLMTESCFGDFYARSGLGLRDRELAVFCFLAALGGCTPQIKAHAVANFSLGNDVRALAAALAQCLPFIGFPRVLDALAVLAETDREVNGDGYDDDPF